MIDYKKMGVVLASLECLPVKQEKSFLFSGNHILEQNMDMVQVAGIVDNKEIEIIRKAMV